MLQIQAACSHQMSVRRFWWTYREFKWIIGEFPGVLKEVPLVVLREDPEVLEEFPGFFGMLKVRRFVRKLENLQLEKSHV